MRSKRNKVFLAFLGSVLVHGIALLLFALIVAFQPPSPDKASPAEEPLKLEMVQEEPPETPPPVPDAAATPTPTPSRQLVVDASGMDPADSPPPDSTVASDRDSRASSAAPGEGDHAGPAQAGRRMASFQFDPRPPAPGPVDRAEPPPATPPPDTAPTLPQPDRSNRKPPAATPPPPMPAATPAPTAAPDEFAAIMATPPPPPEDPFDPSFRSTSPPLPKAAQRPAARRTPAPPPGSLRNEENGNTANRGAGGVDTVATPAGRYTRQVTDMIKFLWNRAVDARGDAAVGSVVIHFTINREGLVNSPRVISNSANEALAAISMQAVLAARLPPMPADVEAELEGKRLPIDIHFDMLPMPQEAARR